LNVAMTRAREHLIMLGNEPLLRKNDLYNQMIERFSRP
jgi:superfamily I DNA and/or RNA helicase